MQWLMGAYAMTFNRRHRRSGHLFQGRFHSFLVDSDAYLAEVLRYVVLTPVRAGMVDDPAKYRWSSYRATAGLTEAPEWLDRDTALEFFGDDEVTAARGYEEFVRAAIGSRERLWDKAVNGIFLGTREWAKKMRKVVESRIRSTDHPNAQRAVGRPRMHTVIDAVARAAGVLPKEIQSARGGGLRRLVAWLGWHEGLVTLRTIAAALRLRSEGHVSNLIRWCEREFASDELLLRQHDIALAALRR
jgi:hypothetical protein